MDGDLLPEFIRMIAALAFVLALIGGLALLMKKLGFSGAAVQSQGKKKRLKVIESLPLDARRRLVIVQRDDVQHVILLGGNTESVVETGVPAPDNDSDD